MTRRVPGCLRLEAGGTRKEICILQATELDDPGSHCQAKSSGYGHISRTLTATGCCVWRGRGSPADQAATHPISKLHRRGHWRAAGIDYVGRGHGTGAVLERMLADKQVPWCRWKPYSTATAQLLLRPLLGRRRTREKQTTDFLLALRATTPRRRCAGRGAAEKRRSQTARKPAFVPVSSTACLPLVNQFAVIIFPTSYAPGFVDNHHLPGEDTHCGETFARAWIRSRETRISGYQGNEAARCFVRTSEPD